MKSISAAIIALAGSILISVGGLVGHDQTSAGLVLTGIVVGLIGFAAWGKSMLEDDATRPRQ